MMTSRTYTNSEQLWHTYSVLWREQVLPGHKTALIVSLILNFWECRAVYKIDRFLFELSWNFELFELSWNFAHLDCLIYNSTKIVSLTVDLGLVEETVQKHLHL